VSKCTLGDAKCITEILRGEGRQNKEVMGDKIYLFVWRENKHMKPIKQSNKCVDVYV